MLTRRSLQRTLIVMAIVAVAGGAWAAISELDQKRLTTAKEMHQKEHERAKQAYERAVTAADDKLRRTYEALIKNYEARGDSEAAEALRQEMDQTVGQAAEPESSRIIGHLDLINAIGPVVQTADQQKVDSRKLANSRYMLVYFSAHWCGPCRAFTPRLVDYVNARRGGNNFNVVFVSSDRSEADMFNYMTEMKMPWATVPFAQIGPSGLKAKYGGRGIPNLVLIDGKGAVISGSYNAEGQYVGPQKVLNDLTKLLNQS